MTKETLNYFNHSRELSQADIYLNVYEWLGKQHDNYDDEPYDIDVTTNSVNISMATNHASENIIDSVSNLNTSSFYTNNQIFETKTPNIFLPKFIFNNRPLQHREELTHQGFNDEVVLDLVSEYRKQTTKSGFSLNSCLRKDSKSANYRSRKLNDSWLKVEDFNEKLILRDKLKKARLKNDLLRTRIKLDLFVL